MQISGSKFMTKEKHTKGVFKVTQNLKSVIVEFKYYIAEITLGRNMRPHYVHILPNKGCGGNLFKIIEMEANDSIKYFKTQFTDEDFAKHWLGEKNYEFNMVALLKWVFVCNLIFTKPCSFCKFQLYFDTIKMNSQLPMIKGDEPLILSFDDKTEKNMKPPLFIFHYNCLNRSPMKKEHRDFNSNLSQYID